VGSEGRNQESGEVTFHLHVVAWWQSRHREWTLRFPHSTQGARTNRRETINSLLQSSPEGEIFTVSELQVFLSCGSHRMGGKQTQRQDSQELHGGNALFVFFNNRGMLLPSSTVQMIDL
jgi:hypothetical protein